MALAVAPLIEMVQGNGGHKCVPERILLVQESRVGPLFHLVPVPPLSHDQIHSSSGIVFVHDG